MSQLHFQKAIPLFFLQLATSGCCSTWSHQWLSRLYVHCSISFVVKWVSVCCSVEQDPMSVGQTLCKPLNSGAVWGPVVGKGKLIPEIRVDSSQGELLPLAEWKVFRVVNLSQVAGWCPWGVSYQDLALISVAGRWGIWEWQKLDSPWWVGSPAVGPTHNLHPCHCDFCLCDHYPSTRMADDRG